MFNLIRVRKFSEIQIDAQTNGDNGGKEDEEPQN